MLLSTMSSAYPLAKQTVHHVLAALALSGEEDSRGDLKIGSLPPAPAGGLYFCFYEHCRSEDKTSLSLRSGCGRQQQRTVP